MRNALAILFAAALLAVTSGCDLNKYCLDCVDLDAAATDASANDGGGDGDGGNIVDAGPPADACTPSGVEVCDGLDNDCNGEIDDGTLAGVGAVCSTNQGECSEGVTVCNAGKIECGGGAVLAVAETCDNKDNDCDGVVDNGDPGGGALCGSNTGECVAGITRCEMGAIACIGEVTGSVEVCDNKDNDCDGMFDEGIASLGSCGVTDVGACVLGSLECVGGVTQCVGAVNPVLETCDTVDRDCDGNPLNGFDLQNDSRNCGTCGFICSAPNAYVNCVAGGCGIAACQEDYWDLVNGYADGCEYGPCEFQSSQEDCNQQDDNCNGQVDENLITPDICDSDGACMGTVATCQTGGWKCNYGPNVEVDMNGDITPESLCDGIDNDCDGSVDEGHPLKGTPCDDGGVGVCRGTGTYICDTANPAGPVICNITTPGTPPGVETCNNLDDNCNGVVDEGGSTGALQSWVNIGAGRQIFSHEASRPDSTASFDGTVNTFACSKPGAKPWTNVTQPEAEAACAGLGARLCTEQEWHRACAGITKVTPAVQPTTGDNQVFLEAELYDRIFTGGAANNLHAFTPDNTTGFSGLSAMQSSPNNGVNNNRTAALTQSPYMEFDVNFTQTGTHYVWVLGLGGANAHDTIHVGIDGVIPSTSDYIDVPGDGLWYWTGGDSGGTPATFVVPSTGVHRIGVYMAEDGFKVDALLITKNAGIPTFPTASSPGCTWSYGSNCTTYAANTCNGLDFDTNSGVGGNQDDILPTGSMAACFANWGASGSAFDMSGNVKEWAAERLPAINPIRGGASNNLRGGMTCGYAFTAADDDFYFPNVGFRCCR